MKNRILYVALLLCTVFLTGMVSSRVVGLEITGKNPFHPAFSKKTHGWSERIFGRWKFHNVSLEVYRLSYLEDNNEWITEKLIWHILCKDVELPEIHYGEIPNGCTEEVESEPLRLLEPGKIYEVVGTFDIGSDTGRGSLFFYLYGYNDSYKILFSPVIDPDDWQGGINAIKSWENEFPKIDGYGILEFEKAVINAPVTEPAGQ